MSKITILKGKVLKGDKVVIEYQKQDGNDNKPAEASETHYAPPHPDLLNAIAKLTVHAILLGEFLPASKLKKTDDLDKNILESYHVSGFAVSGKESEGVVLTAQKTLKTGKVMGFNTPFVAFDDDSENSYPFMHDLELVVGECRFEFEEYLGGKFKDEGQGKLFEEA